MIIKNVTHATEVLARFERPTTASEYSLVTIRRLLESLDNPQDAVRVIHIAGTSGKTSTSYFIAGLLHAAGHQVGLSVSPHIDTILERTQIGMKNINEDEYCELLGEFLDILDSTGLVPSYFEVLVAFSYWVFAQKQVDYAVIEVGLGGLLDGTNVVNRPDKVCVITDIGYDHMNILGDTIEKIATQKAGIILSGNQVFMHHQDKRVEAVIETVASNKNARLSFVDENATPAGTILDLPLFQQRNFALALQAVSYVIGEVSLSVVEEATNTYIPARMEEVVTGNTHVIMDGAHNGQKIQTLVESLRQGYPGKKMRLVVAFNGNRRESMVEGLALLKDLATGIVATEFSSHQDALHQSLPASEIADEAHRIGISDVEVVIDPVDAMHQALRLGDEYVLVVGSFYLLQYVRHATNLDIHSSPVVE